MHETSKLKQARQVRGWSQTQLIAAMKRVGPGVGICLPEIESLKTNIRRWENDHIVPGSDYRKILRAVYAMTDRELGFPCIEVVGQLTMTTPMALSAEGLAYFNTLLDTHITADNLIGPPQVLNLVEHEAHQLNIAAREARGSLRPNVIKMAVRFHEFLGWLQQDSGRHVSAMAATDRACDLAAEIGDPLVRAYLLMRKSNIATDAGEPAIGAALAETALAAAPMAPPRVRAVILRQKANACAALDDPNGCAAAIDQSLEAVQEASAEGDEIAPYCNAAYVAMEAAGCWNRLSRPGQALDILGRTKLEWPDQLRRDKGLYLARMATAHAAAGDVTRACSLATDAVAVARTTRSVRTITELRHLHGQLVDSQADEAETVRYAIASLVGVAA